MAIFSCVVYSSCKNKCGSVVCQNGGTCTSNVCVCATGYYGNTCSSSETSEYIGTYNCSNEKCYPALVGSSGWQSSVVVSVNNSGYTVTINNFAGSNVSYDAVVDSLGDLQIVPAAGSYGVSARGKYTVDSTGHGLIEMNYTESTSSGTGNYSCTMRMRKE